ncbi:hypothetical protein KGM_207531 [Danaus plexippus plexippus]|uniref:Uncharacterized protein n=1 Tax=Danaus plexippus plexippus TaxID=278856 RepID=A0A212EVG0_DANPL|nr:hypothetical protein KGM_207531 [Danaus plexippus plexippus]
MDSREESTSAVNRNKCDRESDKTNSCSSTSKQRGQGDCDENVFTSMSHETDVCYNSQNGSKGRSTTSVSNELSETSNRLPSLTEQQRNKDTQMTNNINNTTANLESTSCSASDTNSRDNPLESSQDKQTCQKHKVCLGSAGTSYNFNAPSTSSASSSKVLENLSDTFDLRENKKRPSTLKLNKPNLDADESSSDTGNDDYSLGSEDGCIYTYRGGEHLADLPSSFYSLDMGLPLDKHLPMLPNYQAPAANVREQASRASSPDMDFLEMDFDPGPSCEVDTGDESTPDEDLECANMPEENEPVIRGTSPEYLPAAVPVVVACSSTQSQPSEVQIHYCNVPSTSQGVEMPQSIPDNTRSVQAFGPFITHINARGEHLLVRRTMSHCNTTHPVSVHISSGDLISPREILNYEEEQAEAPFAHQINQGERPAFESSNLSSVLYHLNMAKKLMKDKIKLDIESQDAASSEVDKLGTSECSIACVEVPRCMVWSEREACERQVTQIGTSACGATAVVNVFIALGVPVNIERINSSIGTRLRAYNAPIPRYLLSRSVAGCTAADLVRCLQRASDGLLTARFFPTHPERAVSLSHWLADWISLGAVPILTMNMQMGCEGEIPDSWHHQMIFGVSSQGVYLTNPLECLRETVLWPRLTSPSVLLVRSRDVLARFTADTDLTPLMFVPDRRFHTFNVLGQVANVIREWRSTGWSEQGTRTRHVRIPASYQAGVTIAVLTGSEAHRRLVHASQLPLLAPDDTM